MVPVSSMYDSRSMTICLATSVFARRWPIRNVAWSSPCSVTRFCNPMPPYVIGAYTIGVGMLRLYPSFGRSALIAGLCALWSGLGGIDVASSPYFTAGRYMER
jgi:hypothetical protein